MILLRVFGCHSGHHVHLPPSPLSHPGLHKWAEICQLSQTPRVFPSMLQFSFPYEINSQLITTGSGAVEGLAVEGLVQR